MKSKIKINYIMFPKVMKTKAGDFSIFTANVIEHLEGEEPIINEKYNTITLKGTVPSFKSGDEFIVVYDDAETNQYGTSYKLKTITKELDKNDINQVKNYLEFVCGKKIAKELMKLDNPLQLLQDRNTEELKKVKGIGESVLERIYKNLDSSMDNSIAYAKLIPLGLSKNLINRICKSYGSAQTAVDVCLNNPYELSIEVKGVSFVIADQIAMKCNLDLTSKDRVKACIYHILLNNGYNGKTYYITNQLVNEPRTTIDAHWDLVQSVICELIEENRVFTNKDGTEIALLQFVELEKQIAEELMRLRDAESKVIASPYWREKVEYIEEKQGWKYTDEQLNGIEVALKENVVVISGKAGTGKTTITNAVTNILSNYDIKQVALSAKASQRIAEVTKMDASTIHRLLNIGFENQNYQVKVYGDIFIVDETSMINGYLFLKLLKALPTGCKLILLGDNGQLTAIGECAVFGDIMKTNKIPHIELTKIHRQAQASAIISKSIEVRNQQPLYPKGFLGHTVLGELQDLELFIQEEKEGLIDVVLDKFKKELKAIDNDILEVQIITAMKNRGDLCTYNINRVIQKEYNECTGLFYENKEGFKIYKGDKVINTKNNYNTLNLEGLKTPLFNGNMGIVKEVTYNELIIEFTNVGTIVLKNEERDAIQLGYAITVHSSQGSQWKRVLCALDMGAYIMLNVEMLYTAITRASKHCSLIAQDIAVKHCLRNVESNTKQTYLDRFLNLM